MNDIDPKVKAAVDQARDVFAGVKDGIQALDYLVEVLKVAPAVAAPAEPQVLVKLMVEVDTSQIDVALDKVAQLQGRIEGLAKAEFSNGAASVTSELLKEVRALRVQIDRAVTPTRFSAARYDVRPQ